MITSQPLFYWKSLTDLFSTFGLLKILAKKYIFHNFYCKKYCLIISRKIIQNFAIYIFLTGVAI